MIIDFSRSGGVGGMTIRTTIDTTSLSGADAANLIALIKPLKEKAARHSNTSPNNLRDGFTYNLTVTTSGHTHTYQLDGGQHRELITYLTEKAKHLV